MKYLLRSWVVLFLIAVSVAQTTTTATPRKRATGVAELAAELKEFRDVLAAQQKQIEALQQDNRQLKDEMRKRDAALEQAQAAVVTAQGKAELAASQATEQEQTVAALRTDVTDLKQNAGNAAMSLQETQKNIDAKLENPATLRFKGINITPGGFLAAETVWRAHALGSDINTPFNSIPFDGANASALSEFFGSGRQSRVSMLAEGKLSSATIRGYVEADFLSSPITANNNESNSYGLRQRQAYAQAALNSGWTFTGGQMWSLVTETKKGVDNRTEATPLTIDPAYTVGFSWARQYGFRVAKQTERPADVGRFSGELSGHAWRNARSRAKQLRYWVARDQRRSLQSDGKLFVQSGAGFHYQVGHRSGLGTL